MRIERVAGAILRDKRVLLVSDGKTEFYWTPGGKIDRGETATEALVREIKEEIGADVTSLKHYFDFNTKAHDIFYATESQSYLIEVDGDIIPQSEITKTIWLSKEDFETNKYKLVTGAKDHLIPKLIEDKLL